MKYCDEAISEFLSGKQIVMYPSLRMLTDRFYTAWRIQSTYRSQGNYGSAVSRNMFQKVTESLMVVIGKKDIQIDRKVDGKELEKATAKNGRASFVYPENVNHVLKHEESPIEEPTPQYVSSHYNAPVTRLDEEAASITYDSLIAKSQTV